MSPYWSWFCSDEWRYNDDDSSSESEEDKEIPPPSKRVGAKRATVKKAKTKTNYSSDDSSIDSDEDKRRTVSRRTAGASVSYKEDSEEDKTDSEDLLEVEYTETSEPVPEEKCETIEKILAQRRGKKGGTKRIVRTVTMSANMFVCSSNRKHHNYVLYWR